MTQSDLTLDDVAPPRRNRVLRLILMVLMTLCGLMMTAILLSNPRVTSTLQSSIGQAQPETDEAETASFFGAPSAQPSGEPAEKPAVSAMPTSRIPVRRVGN